jgi:hypothetical protein
MLLISGPYELTETVENIVVEFATEHSAFRCVMNSALHIGGVRGVLVGILLMTRTRKRHRMPQNPPETCWSMGKVMM